MNAYNIINEILEEEKFFLNQFNEKKWFDEKTIDYFNFLNSENQAMAFFLCIISTMITSIISFFTLANFFPENKNILDGLFLFSLAAFIGMLIVFVLNKSISRFVFNRLYKNRNKNNIMNKLFQRYFYKENISDEIHNMLKVYLSDDDYVRLVKKGLTYKNASHFLNEIIKNEKIIANKREVFLTPEEIKKYQYININRKYNEY